MTIQEPGDLKRAKTFHVQFTLPGLVVFIVSLMLTTGLLVFFLARPSQKIQVSAGEAAAHDHSEVKAPESIPPWGELLVYDTQMERPEEYTALEVSKIDKPKWIFSGKQPAEARQLMLACGLSEPQVNRAFAVTNISTGTTGTIIFPDDKLVFSLSPEVRAKFYAELAKDSANHYMQFPFCFPGHGFEEITAGKRIDADALGLLRPLIYRRGDAVFFSDFEVLMNRLSSDEKRVRLIKVLSARSAVLARVRIRPDTDIEKLLGYWAWAPGVRFTDLRPLLESIKRLPDGGTISLLYLLPQFARERLYTYPLPSQPGDPAMDCHWSTMNFFNDPPDNRFAKPTYTVSYLTTNFYPVAKASHYGDRIFLLDEKGNAIHSGVYIADDIIFTKNGNNYMEPWMLMRLKNLLAMYSVNGLPRMVVYRDRNS